jgi:hypothetical protein
MTEPGTDPRIEWLDRMWFARHPWCRLCLRRALIGERYDWDVPKDPLGTWLLRYTLVIRCKSGLKRAPIAVHMFG